MTRKRHIEPPPAAAANDQAAVFTIPELAKRWKVDRHTITAAIRRRELAAFRVGSRQYRVSEAEVLRFEQQGLAVAS